MSKSFSPAKTLLFAASSLFRQPHKPVLLTKSHSLSLIARLPDCYTCKVQRPVTRRFFYTTMPAATTSMQVPNVVFILGPPGAGKGTQCLKIAQDLGHVHLSAGELLREERAKPGSKYGDLIEKHLKEGSIVPVAITCALLHRAMDESDCDDFLIDGFPRNEDNLTGWAKEMSGKANVRFVLFLECSEDTCLERCLKRGQDGSGRSDDNLESLKKRFVTYMEKTMPIVEHYRKLGLVREVDANRSVDDVFADVKNTFAAEESSK